MINSLPGVLKIPLFLKNISFLPLSILISGIMVRFPTLKLGDNVISKILVDGAAETSFLLPKDPYLSVMPKLLDGSTLQYKAEPHQLSPSPPSGFTLRIVPL